MGGLDDRSNIVILTPEEHFVAHVLLVKIYPDVKDLIIAVSKMTSGRGKELKKKHRKLYGWLRRKHAERMRELNSGSGNPSYGTMWIHQGTNNKRIKKNTPIPEGWEVGRKLKQKHCKVCDCKIEGQKKYCDECRHLKHKAYRPPPYTGWNTKYPTQIIVKLLMQNDFDCHRVQKLLKAPDGGIQFRIKQIAALVQSGKDVILRR